MKELRIAILLSLLVILGLAQKSRTEFRDFSHKSPEYAPLENLRLTADDITYLGVEPIIILGKSYAASKYLLTVNITVQTLCAIGPKNIQAYEQVPAIFEVYIAEDKDRYIHDAYLKMIFDLWEKKESFSGENFFNFEIKGNNYIFSWMPDLVNVKSFYHIWVNERVVKVAFKNYKDKGKGGWGVMDSFTSDNLIIKVAETEFQAYKFPLKVQRKFLELYKKGFFKSS